MLASVSGGELIIRGDTWFSPPNGANAVYDRVVTASRLIKDCRGNEEMAMNCFRKILLVLVTMALTLSLAVRAHAQGPAEATAITPPPSAAANPTPPLPPNPEPQQSADDSDGWRGQIAIYGWFPGIHGTVGVLGHDAGIHVPFSDVFHTLKGIIPVAVELDKRRLVIPVDFFWVKLGDDRGIPFNELGQTSVNVHLTESIFTPKIGYRLINAEHFKFDALAGIRYWYVGQNLTVEPVGVGRSRSAEWVDGLGGVRAILPLSEKASITVAGDAGAGGANLDYQALGLLNYNFTRKWGASLGWRYLYVNYRPTNDLFIFNTAMTGLVAGFSYNFGGKPPVPPSASCTVAPTEVWAGEPVTANISTQNFNPKHTLTYSWNTNAAKVAGTSTTGNVDTTGLAPGSYTVTGTATDPKEKTNNTASCNATFTVKTPHPPVASCSASPDTVKAGDGSTVTVTASSPDNFPLTYSWATSAGHINGTGTSATLDSTGATPGGSITATATVTDSRGLTASCTATVNVLAPPVVVNEVSEIGECKFMDDKRPARVDNSCKAILDDVAMRIQREPNGKFVVVGYAEDEETVKVTQVGAQRSVNIKYYLVNGEGGSQIDAARLDVRTSGTVKEKGAKIYFVPAGATFSEETVAVDETQVKGQARSAPAPRKKGHKTATQAPPAQ
jgi:hypothetical protein